MVLAMDGADLRSDIESFVFLSALFEKSKFWGSGRKYGRKTEA